MAHRRKQTGMSGGRKVNLSTRLYNLDGSRNMKAENERDSDKSKNPVSLASQVNKFMKEQQTK